jgi:cytidylate kinase
LGLGLNFDHYLSSGVLFVVIAAAAVPQAVELDYETQMKNLSSEGTWPNSLKQNK